MHARQYLHLRLATVLLAISWATLGHAQTSSPNQADATAPPTEQLLKEPFVFDLGAFVVSSRVSGGLKGSANPTGKTIDFDQEFGTDADTTRIRASFLWRFATKHALRLSFFDDTVTRTRAIPEDLHWGNYTFRGGSEITAQNRFKIYEISYEYAFLNDPSYKVALAAGIHADKFSLKLAGNAAVTLPDGTTQAATNSSQSSSVTAPLPMFGLRGDWAATDHIYLEASGEVFKFKYQGIDGNWSLIWVGAAWMFNQHFGAGVAFDRFAAHVNLSKDSFTGNLNLGYQGFLIYFKGGF
jgi:hypothetical protein